MSHKRLRFLLPAALLPLGLAALVSGYSGCGPGVATQSLPDSDVKPREAIPVPPVRFTDVTAKAGIDFVHTTGSFGKKLLPETMGGGVAFLDFNKDGKPDLLFVNSCWWPGHGEKGPAPTLRLYRNDSQGGEIRFTDVTKDYGLDVTMYGMGVTVGDYDNDGWPDVFVTGVGGNRLFRNVGGKRFEDVTAKAGVGGPGGWPAGGGDFLKWDRPINWSTSAAWLDYDGDGKLDLFVCNYVTWSPDYDLKLEAALMGSKDRAFGPPTPFPGTQCFLYRNKGDGTFEDVSARAGVEVLEPEGIGEAARRVPVGKSLGVIVCDVDDDGWPDIIVANDTKRNFFFHNKGNGTFEEMGLRCGVGLAEGKARGAMGVDYGEYAPDKRAVVITNFADEPITFLRHDRGHVFFNDAALAEGLAGPSRTPLKFGAFFFDYDLDGRLDILICNGHLEPEIAKVQPGQRYAQPPQLFWNTGQKKRRFEPVTKEAAGGALFEPLVGRGCAYADIDGDGAPDVVLVGNGGPARLLRNEGGTGHHWVRLALEGDGVRSNRSAIGARVTLEAGGVAQYREVAGARGYLSQSELTLTFGLGGETKVDTVTIRWPGKDGGQTVLTDVPVDRLSTVVQGK